MNRTDPLEAEATGARHVVAVYRDHELKIALDVDSWPLDLISVSVGFTSAGKLIVDRGVVGLALRSLLGDQWPEFARVFPQSRDLRVASQEFASAVGLPARDSNDKVFGALPRLLATLENSRDAVEATLAEQGLDYRNRWRFDVDGHRLLTLRRIYVALKHARPDSALAIAENGGKMPHTATDILLMDLYEAVARRAHPSRPMSQEQKTVRTTSADKVAGAVAGFHKRKQERQSAVATATANALARKKAATSARNQ